MFSSLLQIISGFRFADFLDILIVAVFLYFVMIWIKRKASRSVVLCVSFVVVLYTLARILNMYMTNSVFQAGLTAALVGLIIIFQEDIRSAIEHLSSFGSFRSKHQLVASNKTVECIVDSLTDLARDRIGALIAVKGRESIDRHLSGGIALNGRVSTPLLYSLFHPETPSHDGAVIIEGERIEEFSVRLPLSHNTAALANVGTRHTAALGLAERSDALVLVVSEERGSISIAENGKLEVVDKETLRRRIDKFYTTLFPEPAQRTLISRFTQNSGTKTLSLVIAIALWLTFVYRVDMISRSFTLPVEFRNTPSNWVIDDPHPTEIKVVLSGPERSFTFSQSDLVASFDLSNIREGMQTLPVSNLNVNTPVGLFVNQISPKSFTFRASRIEELNIPVKIRTEGKLPAGYQLTDTKFQPQTVRIQVHSDRSKSISTLSTEPVLLDNIHRDTTVKAKLVIPHGVQLLDAGQEFIKVTITVEK